MKWLDFPVDLRVDFLGNIFILFTIFYPSSISRSGQEEEIVIGPI
jgi:hypothetical protein